MRWGRRDGMTTTVKDGCISCGLCTEEFPDLFQMNQEGIAESTGPVPPGRESDAKQAAEDCPVSVIVVTE